MSPRERLAERVAERVAELITRPLIAVEASGRHVHLSRHAVDVLFGRGYQLTRQADLSQPGQFSCRERVCVKGPKGDFPSVIVLGPERADTQVEISLTDALALGVKAPVRLSGDIAGTPGIRLAGPCGELTLPCGVIVAQRHIHITPEDAARFGVIDGQLVSVSILGERSTTFSNVIVRVSPKFATFMHIDYDEANACGFTKGMPGLVNVG